ncbi:heme-binding protein [Natronorarus salvus]|uniref:heme-binding protein n=1 Tax=Natronorarus salvus TaxID=3117733 RepID=UPI002F25EFEC
MQRREPPRTEEGLYALHDFRRVDWPAWNEVDEATHERALGDALGFLTEQSDADGEFAIFSVLGHKADLLLLSLRPSIADLDTASREFERTTFAEFTEPVYSYLSVTEASGYTEASADYFDPNAEADPGLKRYMDSRIDPELPETEFVCFYPMDKRRDPEYNWYDLPFSERAEMMESHGEVGKGYAGRVKQVITGSIGFDDWEWGVTLFSDEMTDIKELITEMRYDPVSSRYAEFGPFYVGRRFAPTQLEAFMAGEAVAVDESADAAAALAEGLGALGVTVDAPEGAHGLVIHTEAGSAEVESEVDSLRGSFEHYDSHVLTEVHGSESGAAVVSVWANEGAANTASGFLEELPGVTEVISGAVGSEVESHETGEAHGEGDGDGGSDIREELAELDIYGGKPHGEDVYALVLYSEADREELSEEVGDLRDGFDRYDTHVKTAVYEGHDGDRLAVVSIWETESAAETASGFLADLPGIVAHADEDGVLGEAESGFGTMGMFYTVKPEHRTDFVGTFDEVADVLSGMEGHHGTELLVNEDDENDMFIASQWRAKEDAMAFFGSEAFRETVRWGRDVLADRPRHVFLA